MTGNLFTNLLSLHTSPVPEEDFFTEVIAWLLDKNSDLLFSWLKEYLNIEENYSGSFVETQVTLGKLEDHLTDSRPDILISLFDGEFSDYVIIESKIGSYEGYEQLPRYAEQMAEKFTNARHRYLIYMTRDYDPKEAAIITEKVRHDVIFKQLRWHEFYRFLQKQPSSPLLNEILAFMRTKQMAEITRITPATLAAFSSFPDVFKFFQTVLNGEVTDQFTKIFGQKPRSGTDQFQYRRHVLYMTTNDWTYLLGFWMPENGEEFPKVASQFYVNGYLNTKKWTELANVYLQVEKDTLNNLLKWKGYQLDKPKSWAYLELACSFSEILNEEDHVAALKQHLIAFLRETKRVLEQYPYILSGVTTTPTSSENNAVIN